MTLVSLSSDWLGPVAQSAAHPTANKPRHDKTNNVAVRPAKTQIRSAWASAQSDQRLRCALNG